MATVNETVRSKGSVDLQINGPGPSTPARRARDGSDTRKKVAVVVCSPRVAGGGASVSRMVEGVEGGVWVVVASREMVGVHGDAEVVLSGTSMAVPPLVGSEQKEDRGGLDLGFESIVDQEKWREGERCAGERG